MGTRRLLLCVAAVTLLAVCQSCSVGREFITTFLQNYQGHMKDHKLQLVLTAQGSEAKVHIQVGSLEFSKQLTLSAHQTKWVCLPYESQLVRGGALANAAVRVSSSADISVVAFNHAPRTSAGTVVAPVTQLGVDYVAFTPGEGPRNMDKLVAVINGNGSNTVTFTPARGLKLRGGASWSGGKEQSVTLAPYETYLVRGNQDLSGTRIRSQQPVAVLGGHQCLSMGLNCEHVYEQLPPVSRMGKEYLVPSTGHDRHVREYAIIVAADDNTEVTVHRTNRNIITRKLQAGEKVVEKVNYKNPMMVRSNRKVMVLFLSNNRPYDPFLMVLAPSCELATDWSVETLGRGMSSRALVLSEREGAASVRVCVGGSCSSPKWTAFLFDRKWVWSSMPLGTVRGHMTVAGDARMAVYVYGGRKSYGYGTAGVCAQGVPPPPPPVDPCDGMTCKEKEKCVKGVCVHTTTATCRAAGDPHYLTFDGRHYDFQGTCTYTMTAVTEQAAGLTPFTVTTKNNHRGSRQVSFVRTVTVSVYNQTISINSHRGKVLVNGELVHLPVSLSGGKVSVKRSGSYAVLTTDFSLRVKYDWNSRLYITVPSSYYRHLGGLCGNYNGDRKDDLSEPTGKRLSAVLKMIQTWKVEDSNPFCSDNCGGHCPYCSPSQRTHYQKPSLCGVLAQKDGPFSACHDAVEPAMYLDNCVYDVCINKGARKILCDNLKSYADACLSEGVKVNPEWRTAANCPLSCPAGSHYEACGSACPSSCGSVDSEKQCTDPCVEGCQCDKGLVLSGDQCVPTSSCGCQHEGRYHPPGTTFWADNSCSSKCSCVRGEVTCKSVTCKKNERCAVKRGVRNCYPESFATCQAKGDPHYRTFDGRGFDFQGTCTYVFSQLVKGSDPDLVPFQVLVQNENRGRNKAVSYTKSVSITVYNNTVSMSSDDRDRVMVNGRIVNLPYSTATEELSIHRSGYFGFVKTAFGLTLKFNWRSNVWLTLPSIYSNAVAGLCGNYNKKAKDDFRKPDGSQDKSPNTFGHSWKAGGGLGCTSDCPGGKCPECAPALSVLYQKSPFCGIISDQKGPFKQCHAKLDHTEFLHDCVYDMCAYKGHTSALCGSLSAFSTACQEAGATVETWRTKDFCPPSCGPNSHYETCAAPCPQTCSGLVSPPACEEEEAGVCTEGCVCEDGFVLSDNTCVPVAECGCQYEGQYYHKGQVVYPGRGCSNRCVCLDDGQMKCDAFTCSANEKCDVSEGVATCVPESRDSCSVGGARTVTSFDGQDYPLWGDCIFTLSEVAEDNGVLTAFSVLLRQHVAKDGGVTRSVEIQAHDYEIVMDTGVLWEIKVDDVRAILPLSLGEGKVRVNQNGINIVVETDFGLTVTYDTIAGVVLELPSTYRTAPRGLCGNYNDKPSDDFVLTGETRPASPGRFTAAWAVVRTGVVCKTGCGDAACPEPSGQKAPECDVIRAGQGPFAGCHAAVPPTPRYDACVKEMSTGDILSSDILCRHIQAYVFSCQSAGANVSRWRTDQFCPLQCPAGSHYELCADTCSSSCSYLLSPGRCPPRHEGCECDEGLAFDGGRCVPMENCGCMVDGLYYKSGVSVFRDDCSESCECQSGRFSCKEHGCQKGEECGAKDGTLGCYTTDPCAELQCREKERCELQEGEAVCVAQSKAVCYGFGDPHYSTFDGWSYSFQGTCSYVLVNTTGHDPSLPQVTVTVKNELRGNDVGSFTRSVSVDLLGHRIDILRGQSGTVEVDGIRMRLPIILDGGSISITESGIRGVLQANIGVEVTFDWSTLIMVSISSSFHGNVGGLCGNYNGDRGDELAATRTGTAATTVVEWAKSWSVADDDVFCYHQCEGKCPQCATQDRLRLAGPQYCGVLANKTGPFSGCHAKVPVKQFAQDCLYDVCVNDGRQEVLCEALASYHAECQEGGVNVSPWREIANCPLVCPANSHYETCGTSCPETCGPKAESCPQTCVEGCFCDKGYVLSGHKCVIREKGCGCNHEDRYYLPGEVFWADKRCRSKCACDPATQKVACERRGCKAGEHCSVVDGVQDCYPVTFSTCQAQGDPHFRTFDGRKFDFQGNCVYRLASVCNETEGLERFEVSLESNNRGNTKVSYAKVVTVNVYGHSFTLALDYPGQVLVDGEAVHLPYSCNQSLVRVHRGNRLAVIETHFLKVSYDWRSLVRVQVATTYQNTLCGLCGNLNGDPKDDLTLPNGKAASSATEFGLSQWLANVPSCSHECKDCPPAFLAGIFAGKPHAFTAVCEVIVSKDGPLRDCVSRVDSKQFRSDCIYDMTLTLGKDQAPACDIIADYVQECQEVGGNVENWRTKDFCSMNCPANSRYSLSAPGCPVTCSTPASKCRVPPSEGCVCNSGYLLSQDGCVRLSQCGCQFEGRYVPSGVKFYADADCQRFCVCSGGGTVSCEDKPCTGNKKCGVRKGKRFCYSQKDESNQGFDLFGAIKKVVDNVFDG